MKFLLTVVASLSLLAGAFGANDRPHIVFVLSDDLGFGDLGLYNYGAANTPNINRLATQGIRFWNYYSASPICSPSRCGLITGNFPARWSITSYLQTKAANRASEQADFLDPTAPSLPRALRAAGYATAHIGKWHLGGGRDVENPPKFAAYGYDENVGTWESPEPDPNITATDWIWSDKDRVKRWERCSFFVDRTLDFIARHKNQPCFVNLWFDDPHTPWIPDAKPPEKDERQNSPERLAHVLEEMDRQVGRLMDSLPENTLLIFASDNGALPTFNGARSIGLRGSKMSLYEGGIRLPFIARWPGRVPENCRDDTTVLAAVDMLPTLCAIANAPVPPDAKPDGQDMSSALLGMPIERNKPLFWEYGRNPKSFGYPAGRDRSPSIALRDGKWKLLVNANGTGAELYDVVADAVESKNVASQNTELTRRLTDAALAWFASQPKGPAGSNKPPRANP
jgi:arylsulfatase A-like enzyme